MSRELADYLDAASAFETRSLGTNVVPSGTIAPMPVPGAARVPQRTVVPAVQAVIDAVANAGADRAAIDAAMWSLDAKWLPKAEFVSMRSCVRTTSTVSAVVTVTPYVTGACKNAFGADVQPTCNWGFWRIDECSIDAATSWSFQYARYLWAQARMRELLANKPTRATSPGVAAEWGWTAMQLISAMLWSTNVRFDNPNSVALSSFLTDRFHPPATRPSLPSGYYFFDPAATDIRLLNNLGYSAIAPTNKNEFSPGQGPLAFMYSRREDIPAGSAAAATPTLYSTYVMSWDRPYTAWNVPPGIANEEIQQVKNQAYGYFTSFGASALRWASTKAMWFWWFNRSWNWAKDYELVPDFKGNVGTRSRPDWKPFAMTSARLNIEALAKQMEFWTGPSAPTYIDWLQQAMQSYTVETSGIGPSSPAAIDFIRARTDMNTALATASGQAAMLSRTAGSSGGDAATITSIAVSLFQTVISLIGQSAPLIGQLYGALTQVVQQTLLAGGSAVGNTPCPAFPFIRIMAPPGGCDLPMDQIVSSLLGIDSNARWPVSIGGQTRTFQIDGKVFTASFTSSDTTAELVARRINAAAALVGLAAVASVRNGQVHVEGRDPGAGPAKATGGTAAALGFPGPVSAPAPTPAPSPTPGPPTGGGGGGSGGTTPSKSSSLPLLVGGALLLRFLLG